MVPSIGLHRDVSWEVYASWEAVSGSVLEMFEKSAAHARWEMLHPSEPTKALDLGSAIHCSIFEPGRFGSEYAVAPKVDKRYKEGKAAWAEFEAAHEGFTILRAEEFDTALACGQAVWAHPVAQQLLSGKGLNEVSIVWRDSETGLLCKGRMDRLTTWAGYPCIVDLKSVRDASYRGFSKAVATYGWHRKAAMYLDGCNALDERPRRFLHIAAEKEGPCANQVYELISDALSQGRVGWRKNLHAYKVATETNTWEGYPAEVTPLDLPRWDTVPEETR
jgi:hypothetical protein